LAINTDPIKRAAKVEAIKEAAEEDKAAKKTATIVGCVGAVCVAYYAAKSFF